MIPTSLVQEQSNGVWQVAKAWLQHFSKTDRAVSAVFDSGTTANRPTSDLWVPRPYFDTTLNKPIWYTSGGWRDATGTLV